MTVTGPAELLPDVPPQLEEPCLALLALDESAEVSRFATVLLNKRWSFFFVLLWFQEEFEADFKLLVKTQ